MIEVFSAGKGESYVYTTSREFAKLLASEFEQSATYREDGDVYAWQFIIPNNRVKFYCGLFRRKFDTSRREFSAVANQRVTERHQSEFAFRDKNAVGREETDGLQLNMETKPTNSAAAT